MIIQPPEIVSQSKIEETDYNTLKIVLLGVIGVAASIFAVYEFDQFLLTFQYAFLWFSLAGLLVFVTINLLLVFFVKHFLISFGIIFAETFLPILFFVSKFSVASTQILLAGFLLFFLFVLFGMRRGLARFRNSINLKFFEVARLATPRIVTGALILAGVLFYSEFFLWGGVNERMLKDIFIGSLKSSEPIVHLWYSDVSTDQTVKEFFGTLTQVQLKKNPTVSINGVEVNMRESMKELPIEQQMKIMSTLSSELQKKIEKSLNMEFPANAKVSDILYGATKGWVESLAPNVRVAMGVLLTVVLFLTVKGVAFLLYGIINIFAFLVFKLLVVANFAVTGYETRTREFVIVP